MRRIAPGLIVIAILVFPVAALAARAPSHAEREGITRVMRGPGIPQVCFPLNIRVSTLNRNFAAASYRNTYKCGVVVGNGVTILKRVSNGRWRILEVGSSLGCRSSRLVPPAIIGELLGFRC